MSKLRLITYNYLDVSEITSSPTMNRLQTLKSYDRGRNAQTNPAGGTLSIDTIMGSPAPVTAVVIGRHNLPIGVGVRFRLFDVPSTAGTEVYDSGTIIITAETAGSDKLGWGTDFSWGSVVWGADGLAEEFAPRANFVHWIPEINQVDTQSIQAVQVQIYYADYDVEIGRIIIGEYIEPTYNISYGHGLSWQENTKQFRREGNTLRSNITLPSRRLEFSLNTINEADRAVLQAGLRNVGLRRDLFISLFPTDIDVSKTKDYSGIVKLTKIPVTSEYTYLYYKSKYVMEEV